MMIAVPAQEWAFAHEDTFKQVAETLRELAARVPVDRMLQCRRGPKKRETAKSSGSRIHHVSTRKLLDQAKGVPPPAGKKPKSRGAKG